MVSLIPDKKRYAFIDIARGLAILEMIHGHCLHALLAEPWRDSGFMSMWQHVRSVTAPLFLFIAGFSLTVATLPKIDDYTRPSPRLVRRISRILFIIAVGYVLHLPFFSLHRTVASIGSEPWYSFLNVDILQCIGISLLVLQGVLAMHVKESARTSILVIIAAGILVATPYMRSASWVQSLPVFVRYYFTASLFPLFPFTAYCLFGALCGNVFMKKRSAWVLPGFMISASLVVCALLCMVFTSNSGLSTQLLRSAVLVVLMVLLYLGENTWQRFPPWILVYGQESLVLYVLHLMVIYGSVFNKGIINIIGSALSFGAVYSVFIALLVVLTLVACAWHYVKRIQPDAARSVRYALYITFLIRFLTRPY